MVNFCSRDVKSEKCLPPRFIDFFSVDFGSVSKKFALLLRRSSIAGFLEKFVRSLSFGKSFLFLLSFEPLKIRKLFLNIVRSRVTHCRYHAISQACVTRQMNSCFAVLKVLSPHLPIAVVAAPKISCASKMSHSNETSFTTEMIAFWSNLARHYVSAKTRKSISSCVFSCMCVCPDVPRAFCYKNPPSGHRKIIKLKIIASMSPWVQKVTV